MARAFVNEPRYHSRATALAEVRVTVGLLTHIYTPGETFEAEPSDILDLAAQGLVVVPDYNRGRDYHELIAEAVRRLNPPPAPEVEPELATTVKPSKGR
jgi:hypothetical protein